ncbi:MAG: amidohydrolase family protein [Propionibacteriaceae bacterium]|jgi:imidazolonepropionase-like amidohydrolase|nr:amidohydrolase family protein [Propionibacteriaceae bacterium]
MAWYLPDDKLAELDPRTPLHLQGVVLPEGHTRDLFIKDGHVVLEADGAVTVARDGFILPGLVDSHCHISLGKGGAIPDEQSRHHAELDRDAGALLLREVGAPNDTHWVDSEIDLPRMIRAGRHIARPKRYIRGYAVEIEPEDLAAEVEIQAKRGDGWVKLVGDWIDRSEGDLLPLWPEEAARAGIERAHELGVRITAHCFGEESVAQLVRLGIDGIEHGTGLDESTAKIMAEHQTSLVPTLTNIDNFVLFAAQGMPKYPKYSQRISRLYKRRMETFARAVELGVPIYAGTDAGGTVPHGLINREIRQLALVGGAEFALGAASWRAREWLGESGRLIPGAHADLIVYNSDPREHLWTLDHPGLMILKGKVRPQGHRA